MRRPRNFDLVVIQAAQPIRDRRHAAGEHPRVRDHQRVGLEPRLVRVHEVPQAHAANFFFSFDHHFQIDGQLARRFHDGVERANVDVHLALVVGGAAAIQISAANRGFKCRRGPQVQRLGRLHIVMPVEKDGRLAGRAQRFAVDQRMHLRRHDFDVVEARRAQLFGDPFRGALDVRLVLGLRADARNPQKFVELVQVFFALGIDVFGQVHMPVPS